MLTDLAVPSFFANSGGATLQASDSSDVAPMSRKTTENFYQFLGPGSAQEGRAMAGVPPRPPRKAKRAADGPAA